MISAVATIPARHAGSCVVAPLLNRPEDRAALGETVHAAPYKAPPRAPVLYLRPRNTWSGEGDAVVVPSGVAVLRVGATLGAVIGRVACRVAAADALQLVAGWVIVNDLAIPHTSLYRPALRERCRDGFCAISLPHPREALGDPDAATWRVLIDGQLVEVGATAGAVRPFGTLLADITEFMTLHPGDIALLGASNHGPLAAAGQTVSVEIGGLGRLTNRLVGEGEQR